MYTVLFTSDYEIHGSGMGSPDELMVEPTTRMLDQFDRYGAKLSVFADVGEIQRFKEYAEQKGTDRFAWGGIKRQLERCATTGHDVQLHIHSSYYGATFDEAGGFWKQNYAEYDLANLPYARLVELVRGGKRFLEDTLRPVAPGYRCFAFRAANWSMQPSPAIVRALVDAGFTIDTSVWKHGVWDDLVRFDYRGAHHDLVPWPVAERDVCERDERGKLFEFPIYTERQPLTTFLTANRVYRVVAQRLNPLPPPPEGALDPMSTATKAAPRGLSAKVGKAARMALSRHAWKVDFNQCTGKQLVDALLRVEARYGHPAVPLPFVLIGHSKTFTRYNERMLAPFLAFVAAHPDRFRFGTFRDFDPEAYRQPVLAA